MPQRKTSWAHKLCNTQAANPALLYAWWGPNNGPERIGCPSPDGCSLAQDNACKPYGRLNVVIGDDDPLGSFVFRTTGYNSIRTLAARLHYLQAISGNRLACLPLELRLRGKSTRQSQGTPIFYVDITVRSGLSLEDALLAAKQLEETRQAAGFNLSALDQAARQGFSNGAFEDNDEDTGPSSRSSSPQLKIRPARQKPPPNQRPLPKPHWYKSWNPNPSKAAVTTLLAPTDHTSNLTQCLPIQENPHEISQTQSR